MALMATPLYRPLVSAHNANNPIHWLHHLLFSSPLVEVLWELSTPFNGSLT